ncbi:hypothetical protein N7481_008278 [Penicillium waksmanii]|uniref:uncharacterized protein n=1 Tax=Penicillium waksmanii TaxID=69791 RepID=UPI002546C538|nr:uncharacterized protein N7481_008278 [Penicillium waksmanii]KAJ5980980.1 hypothetical protein N7481_008278 [Penicillium waksmanii]
MVWNGITITGAGYLTYDTIFLTSSGSVKVADVDRSCVIDTEDINAANAEALCTIRYDNQTSEANESDRPLEPPGAESAGTADKHAFEHSAFRKEKE